MIDTNLRVRVERLLRDDFRVEDLTTLLLAMRFRSGGRETVREIGDFVAHRDERTKGIITRSTRDFFITLKFLVPYIPVAGSNPPPLSIANLPASIREFLPASLRQINNDMLQKETGLKRATAEKLLKTINSNLKTNADGTLFLAQSTPDQLRLIQCLAGVITSKSAFDGDRLFQEFSEALIGNNLLAKNELKAFAKISPALSLYAVSVMHKCVIDLGDGSTATLGAMANTGHGKVGVFAHSAVKAEDGKDRIIAGSIFETGLNAQDCCEPELLGISGDWPFHIELTQKQQLTRLR